MTPIIKILGDSNEIFFQLENGDIILGSGEFKAGNGSDIWEFFVYQNSLQWRNSGESLSAEEQAELMQHFEVYRQQQDWCIELEWI